MTRMASLNMDWSIFQTVKSFIVVVLLYLCLKAIYNVYLHPLSRFPGPKLWAAFRFPYVSALHQGILHQRMRDFHDRWPNLGIVRIAPNELSFINPEATKDIYLARLGHDLLRKSEIWMKPPPGEPSSILGSDEEVHARDRKLLAPAFSGTAMQVQAPVIEKNINLLIRRLQELVHAGDGAAVVDLVEWFNFTTFDIVGDLAFGDSFGSLRDSQLHPWVAYGEVSEFGKTLSFVITAKYYHPFNKILKYVLPKSFALKRQNHRRMTQEKLQQRLQTENARPDFVTALTRHRDDESGMPLRELETNAVFLILAGSETTSSGLSGICRMLLQERGSRDNSLDKLVRDIRNEYSKGEDITLSSVTRTGELDYLGAVINEGIRLCPPVALGVPRLVPAAGDTICGHRIPGGTFVAYNQFASYRSRSNFSRPNEFVPARWQDPLADGMKRDRREAFQPFSIGRHSCIGKNLAQAEMRLILTKLLWHFDLRLQSGHKATDWGDQKTYIFWEKEPLLVQLKDKAAA